MNQFKHAKWWRSYLDKLKQAFSYTKASQQKEKSKEKQREAKRSKEENRGQQLQSSFALLEHFPKSIFYMLYTISKLRKSRIQRFKPCTIWSWNEEDMAFGRQLHQAMGTPFRKEIFFMVRNLAISHHEEPPCEISQGGFSPCEIWTLHLSPFENAFEIPCFETLLMIFHCRFSKIFCLTFSFVNTYFTLVINQWKGCFCNSSCNLAFYYL